MSGVDVLAVMDADGRAVACVIDECQSELRAAEWEKHLARHDEARAAVAELIEAAQEVIDGTVNAVTYPDGPCIERKDRQRLIAALARCGGAA